MTSPIIQFQTDPTSEGLPVIGLVRVSTAEQGAEGRCGLDRQREVIRRTVATKGLNLLEVKELVDVSGTATSAHPAIREVLARVANGSVRGVVVADLDRLFRPDRPESFATLQVFQDMGAKIYSGDSEYDLQTKDGLLFSSIRSAIAGFELGLMKERQHGAKEAKRKSGKCPTNLLTLPTGITYCHKKNEWGLTPDITKVLELFRLVDEEGRRNFSELGRLIGVCSATVRNLLSNRIYTGIRIINQKRGAKRVSKSGKTYREKVARSPGEIIRVKVFEPVISEQCFERVQAALKEVKFNHLEKRQRDPQINLGTGIAVCAHCGQPIFCISGRRGQDGERRSYYQCKANHYAFKKRLGGCALPNTPRSDLDAAIHSLAKQILSSPKFLVRLVQRGLEMADRKITVLPAAMNGAAQEEELRRREQRLIAAYEENVISLDELRAKRETLEKQRALLRRLEAKENAKATDGDAEVIARRIIKGARRFQRNADKLEQKKIIHELFAEVHVRERFITGVRFRDPGTALPGAEGGQTLPLPEPLRIGDPPPPPGKRQCIKCQEWLPESEFYRKTNACHDCRRQAEGERYRRRAAKRSAST